jgi:Tol biopolymer transport system component
VDRTLLIPVSRERAWTPRIGGATLNWGELGVVSGSPGCHVSRLRRPRRVLTAAASLATLVAIAVGGGKAALTTSGALVFVSSREGSGSLYVINADGSGLRRLVDSAWDPTWSPKGRALAFFHDEEDKVRLEVIDADGSGRRRAVGSHNYNFSALSWSPDETQIAYEAIAQKGLYVANADGSGERLLVSGVAWRPAWSPDGSRIAFIRRRDGDDALAVVNADGTGERPLRTDVSFAVQPAWSPDAAKILFGR